eukprot:1183276-Prorocentrum_minimum.AAC.2
MLQVATLARAAKALGECWDAWRAAARAGIAGTAAQAANYRRARVLGASVAAWGHRAAELRRRRRDAQVR